MPSKWATVIQHKFLNPQEPLLAHDKVRHVGEAIAIIVAETRNQAEDAAEQVEFDLEELPAVVDPETALRPDSPIVHDRFGTNLIGEFSVGRGDVDAAFRGGAASARAPLLPPPLCRGADGMPRCRRPIRSARRSDDDLVVDPGRALGAARGGGAARPARGAGALRRPRCRRRLWRQGPCLPRRPAGHVSRPPARPPGALDRGAARAHDERHPFARPVARCRSRV